MSWIKAPSWQARIATPYRERNALAPYVITLLDQDGAALRVEHHVFEHDDEAIDHAGRSGHPHEIKIHQGERLVAHFPRWRAQPR